ncbi:MAG: TonB-dependent receptor [Cytophagales bacterium]|nr:TonB-dependent receptor [Cytophagales bacterium]
MNYFLRSTIGRAKGVMCLLVMFCCLVSMSAHAQGTISGRITDENGEGLPGVTIRVQGTSTGTSTDIDGNFNVTAASDAVLEISSIGFRSESIAVNGRTIINVTMEVDVEELNEVVVIGYGSVQKSDITGSVSSVKTKDLQAFPLLNAAQALQGRAAGVVVQSENGGEPGASIDIKIRGATSFSASSSPLVVVDGFVGATMPQQNDIESIEILKDASAAAIYGSRGSNGVILVTTKKGVPGKVTVEVNSTISSSETSNRLDLLNADQFAEFQQILNPAFVQGPANTDWQEVLFRNGTVHNHQFSVAGGSENINFYASANYFNQEGVIINSAFERVSFLANMDAKVNDKVKIGVSLFTRRSVKDGVSTQSTGQTANGGGDDVIGLMFRFRPDLGIFNDDGSFTSQNIGGLLDNPFAVATERIEETKEDRNRANLYLDYKIIEGLSFRTTLGLRSRNENISTFIPSTLTETDGGLGGTARISNRQSNHLLNENFITYTRGIGEGNLTFVAGHSYQRDVTERFSAGAQGLIKDSFSFHNLAGADVALTPTSSFSETEIESQFGRVNFDWADKYLITATVRRDGSSRFSENEKYAIFPSAAVGWRVSNEPFLSSNPFVSNLKVRASYGVTGNTSIPALSSFATFDDVAGLGVGGVVAGVVPDQAANGNLRWESSYQTNLGLDLGLFDDRVELELNYYNIDTEDLLMPDFNTPLYLGNLTRFALTNIGEINNKGFEISLGTSNIITNDLQWTTDFNWSTNRTEVITLIDGLDVFLDASPGYFSRDRTHILREGEVPGMFWGYVYQGVFTGGALPEGTAMFEGGTIGDPMFAEVADVEGNFDGVIDTNDQQIIGDPTPDFTFGINNTVSYKNFDLNVFIQGSQGGEIFNLTRVQLLNGDANASTDILNAWTLQNPDSNIPRVGNNSQRELSTRFVEDGSYIRLKNLALGYTLPAELVEKVGLSSARVSFSAQNLLTITDYSGLDPEVSYFGGGGESTGDANTTNGFDYGNYPTIVSYTFSLNLKF